MSEAKKPHRAPESVKTESAKTADLEVGEPMRYKFSTRGGAFEQVACAREVRDGFLWLYDEGLNLVAFIQLDQVSFASVRPEPPKG